MSARDYILAFLLNLNLACAAQETAGARITPPGLPAGLAHAEFISDNCIRIESDETW